MPMTLLRQFRLQPLYAITCAVTLALAVGAGAASFTVVKRALFDALPYPDAARLVAIKSSTDERVTGTVSVFIFEDLKRAKQHLLTAFAQIRFASPTVQFSGAAESVDAQEVTPEYFETLKVYPALGSVWQGDARNVVLVSHRFWQRWLSGDAAAIGRSITIDGVPREVAGVMPEDFIAPYGPEADLWMPLDMRPLLADTARARRTILVLARLAPGVGLSEAEAFMATFSADQRAQYPAIHSREKWLVRDLAEDFVGPTGPALIGTGAAALLLLLIACANIAGLSAVNAAAQGQRHAIRAALGASAARMFRERLIDSLAIAMAGSLMGLWLAYALIAVAASYQRQFLALMPPVAFEWSTALIGVAFGVITGVAAALAPQAAVRRLLSGDPLRAARAATGDRKLARVRSGLVFVQVAIAMVLVIGAGLLVRTVSNLSETSLGFNTAQLTFFTVSLPLPKYNNRTQHLQFEREVLERVSAIPGVTGASASVGLPAFGSMGARLWILDRPDPNAPPDINYYSVTPKFFSFLDVPIVEGRDIEPTDTFEAPRVVVINQTMARMFWPDGNAVGSRVKIGAGAASDREIIVVGIAADVRDNGPLASQRPSAYGSTLQYSWPRRHIAVKTDRMYASLPEQLRAAVHTVDPEVATSMPRPIDHAVAQQLARHRLVMFTLTLFSAVATALCGLGLYATVALNSQFRRREYAIRVALGSTRAHVCWLVLRQSLAIAGAGAITGVILAAATTDVLSSLLHGVTPLDAVTFAAAIASMLALAALSASLPAVKAGRIDPAYTLRAE